MSDFDGLGKAINGLMYFAVIGIVASAVAIVFGGVYLCLHVSLVWH